MLLDGIDWNANNAREAIIGESMTLAPGPVTVVTSPDGSSSGVSAGAVTFTTPGWHVLSAASTRVRVLVFSAAAADRIEAELRGLPHNGSGPHATRAPLTVMPSKVRMVMRALANHAGMAGGEVADLVTKNLKLFGGA